MAKFRVIEGTVWEIEAETLEQAKAFYEGHFNGDDNDSSPMREVAGDAYWFDSLKEHLEIEAKQADLNLEEAQRIEEESDYSDAMLSMDRTYAEGFADALALAIRLVEEAGK